MSSVLQRIKPRSLRVKLLLLYSVVFAVSAVALVLLIYSFAAHQLKAVAEQFLKDETDEFVRQAAARMPDIGELTTYLNLEIGKSRSLMPFYRMVDAASGDVLMTVPESAVEIPLNRETLSRAMEGRETVETVNSPSRPGAVYKVRTDILDADGRTLALQCGFLMRELHERLDRLKLYLGLAIVATVLVAVAGGWFLASRSVAPMADVVRTLRRIRAGDLARRLPARPVQDELGVLTSAINSMLDELELAFERTRSFTADVAHELRTPLASLRCELEVTLDQERSVAEYLEVLTSVLGQTKKLSATTENLLFLAKADSSASLPDKAAVKLTGILTDLVESFDALAEANDVNLSADIAPDLEVNGNADWLKIVFGNLLDNAMKYTPSGGRVFLRAIPENDYVRVSVEDTGSGILPEDLDKVFDRFYRADKSRSRATGGAGLGLSITKRIVELHGGQITARSQPGKGTSFEVVLPCAGTPDGPIA